MKLNSAFYLDKVGFEVAHKKCFGDLTTTIARGAKIGVIGRNGSGKSSLLKILNNQIQPTAGEIYFPQNIKVAYIDQFQTSEKQSGGEHLYQLLIEKINENPDLLLLDEPTNHLDYFHKQQLIELLEAFTGRLIVISHDVELLEAIASEIWHIENGKVDTFKGKYSHYLEKTQAIQLRLENKLKKLLQEESKLVERLAVEQRNNQQGQKQGQKASLNNKYPKIIAHGLKLRAQETHGKKVQQLAEKKAEIKQELLELELSPAIKPRFLIAPAQQGQQNIISITQGVIFYQNEPPIITEINLSLGTTERLAIQGQNGSGKSSLIKALLNRNEIIKTGNWHVIEEAQIGYLDQYYEVLNPEATVYETILNSAAALPPPEIRKFLADFLFYKNEQVDTLTKNLSGGEKVRLILALICAKSPRLLILDELTNNLDLETRNYVIQVLNIYAGALIVISHDYDFLRQINIQNMIQIKQKKLFKNPPR